MADKPDGTPNSLSRRKVLKRAGAAGVAIAWATPTVQGINMTSAAAQGGTDVVKSGTDPVKSMTLRLDLAANGNTGDACIANTTNGTLNYPVDVYAFWGTGGFEEGYVPIHAPCTTSVQGSGSGPLYSGVASASTLVFGDGIAKMNPNLYLLVVESGVTNTDCTYTTIHTSCSQVINIGEACGPWLILAATT